MKLSTAIPEIRNRRISTPKQRKQQHLLDVKVRSRKASAQRTRWLISWCCKAILFVGIITGLYVGAQECLRRFLWENPYYALAEIRVHGADEGTLTRDQILGVAGIAQGTNIFLVNLPTARANLIELPQIADVEIQRLLPNRIAIHLTQRKPVAWLAPKNVGDPSTTGDSFLIDASGILISPKPHQPTYLHLPVITGIPLENMHAGDTVRAAELKAALDLVKMNSDSTRFSFGRIDISKGYCMVATERKRARVTFGLDRIDQQIERLGQVVDRVSKTNNEIRTVNLLVKRNVPVTFMEPEPVPAPSVTPTPTFRSRVDATPAPKSAPPAPAAARPTKPASPLIKPFTVDEPAAAAAPRPKKPVPGKSTRKGGNSR